MSNERKHTPGPWRTPGPTETKMAPVHTEDVVLAHVGAKSLAYEENDANARLIAAAPELLEAAEHIRREINSAIERNIMPASAVNTYKIDSAIAKATGQDRE